MAVQTQIQTRRGTAASWTSTNPTLAAGEIGFETDTGKFKIGNGSTAWASLAYSAGATAVTYLFNATAGQTTFSGADANGLTLAYTVGAEQVYLNGVLQVRGSDYTATNGTSIVLASGALVSDVLNVIAYSAMTITDTYTQAQADAKFFQNANAFVAGKNKIINGNFANWQRSTSASVTADAAYLAPDRFATYYNSGGATTTWSRQTFTPGTAPVAGYEGNYFSRIAATSGSGSTEIGLFQKIEDVQTFAGQTATFSFWAKGDSARTAQILVYQQFGTGGSGGVLVNNSSFNLTTSWTRFTFTMSIPSISGKTIGTGSFLSAYVVLATGNASGSPVLDTWGWQLEAGSIATAFQTATGTIQGELAACQRYYWRATAQTNYSNIGWGLGVTTATVQLVMNSPVQMRTVPTSLDYLNLLTYDGISTYPSITSVQSINATLLTVCANINYASGITAGRMYQVLSNNTTNSYLGFSAEL